MVNREIARGLLLVAVSAFFLAQASTYRLGTLSDAGPALFPTIIASFLFVLGVVIIVRSYFIQRVPLDFQFRNIAIIIASLVCFALISELVNMIVAIIVLVTIASLASGEFSVKRIAAISTVLCVVAFVMKNGLGVQFPLY